MLAFTKNVKISRLIYFISSRSPTDVRFVSSQPVINLPEIQNFDLQNETILNYLPGSKERGEIENAIRNRANTCEDIPIIINGKEYWTKEIQYQIMPSDHKKKLAKFSYASTELIQLAIESSLKARTEWEKRPLREKVEIFLKAADLVSGKYRFQLNAATMLGQGKTVFQAEIDSAAELADFFRFNAAYAQDLCKYQPLNVDATLRNTLRHRGLEGFVAAISPFNFTAIGGNLAYAPALMGNVVLWKPSDTAMLSNYLIYRLMEEAGMPAGVINFVPSDGPTFGRSVTNSVHLSAINFTGSVRTFQWLWAQVGSKIDRYRSFPRLVGECGGKNYHFVHSSADVQTVINATLRAAYEYSGQKCSACARMYVPSSLWPKIKEGLVQGIKQMKIGPVTEFDTFTSAVIDERAFTRIAGYVKHAQKSSDLSIITGGQCNKDIGYYISPTLIESRSPHDRILTEEIFGPILAVYVYEDNKMDKALELAANSTSYALTGSIFGEDQQFLIKAAEHLKMSAGNFYINDKSTGAVVGQQPFGGSRLSGTNDKAGCPFYLLRWTSPQAVKQNFQRQTQWKYPYMNN